MRQYQLGIPLALRGRRKFSVEAIGAESAVDRRLWLGEVCRLRCETQPIEFGSGRAELGAINVAADPPMVERSGDVEPGRDRPRQIGAECRSERLRVRQIDST